MRLIKLLPALVAVLVCVQEQASAGACVSESGFAALVRASRRGESYTNFSSTGAPGSSTWGDAYDSDNNSANFGYWTNVTSLGVRNSTAPSVIGYSGNPVTELVPDPKACLVQVGDPTSLITSMTDVNPADF